MAATKTIRFTKLVEHCGRPQVVTIWTAPKENPSFQRAVRENRVLTVRQDATGAKKDYGRIGFFRERGVSLLVFPKALPKSNAQVIGIKYELVR
jgi:hypothetical protein